MTRLYAWNEKSRAARDLSKALGILRIKHEGSNYRGAPHRLVLNYGASQLPDTVLRSRVMNNPQAVARMSNKLSFFHTMSQPGGPRLPDWTDDPVVALTWHQAGEEVVARQKLAGHSGEGIVFLSEAENIGQALRSQLFTKYKKKQDEYRVHFVQGRQIDVQKKLLRTTDDVGNRINPDDIDFRVRNLANGFIFGRNDIDPPQDVLDQARLAFGISGLDFGGIDVIWNNHENRAYVLEINTAPGLQGTTLEKYTAALRELINA